MKTPADNINMKTPADKVVEFLRKYNLDKGVWDLDCGMLDLYKNGEFANYSTITYCHTTTVYHDFLLEIQTLETELYEEGIPDFIVGIERKDS